MRTNISLIDALMLLALSASAACGGTESVDHGSPDATSVAIEDEAGCLVSGAGTWNVSGTLPAGNCYFSNEQALTWASTLTITFTSDDTGGIEIAVADSLLDSTARARDKPALLFSAGRCNISGYMVDSNNAIASFSFVYDSETEADFPINLTYGASCDDSFQLSASR
jgi:hypothetical protein